MAENRIAIEGPNGEKGTIPDTAESRQAAEAQGFKVPTSLLQDVGEVARGAEAISQRHAVINYNPLTWVPRAIGGAIADAAGVKSDDALKADAANKAADDHALDGRITIQGPDGSRGSIPNTEESRKAAAEQGFTEINALDLERERNAEATSKGLRGDTKAYLDNVYNQLTWGVGKASASQDEKAENAVLDRDHETAGDVGAVVGFGASMLMPGSKGGFVTKIESRVGKELAKLGLEEGANLGSKVAVGAAKGATGGALYSMPHAIAQEVYQDDAHSGEAIALGLGVGAVLGGMGPLASKFLNYVRPLAADKIASAADERLMKNVGLERGTLNQMGSEHAEQVGRTLIDAGVVTPGQTQKTLIANVEKLQEKSGQEIGAIHEALDKAVSERPELASNAFAPGTILQELKTKIESNKGPMFTSVRNEYEKAFEQIALEATGKEFTYDAAKADGLIKEIGPLSFEKGNELKQMFGASVDHLKGALDGPTQQKRSLQKQIYGMVRDELADATGRVSESIGAPQMKEAYDLARQQYHAATTVSDRLVPKLLSKQAGNRWMSPSDWGAAHIGEQLGLGHAVSHAAHGASAVLGGIGGAVASYAAKKAIESTPFQSGLIAGADKTAGFLRAMSANQITSKIEQLDSAITRLASRVSEPALDKNRRAEGHPVSPISSFIGGTEKDGAKALPQLEAKLDELLNDPKKLQTQLGPVAQTISDAGDPNGSLSWMNHQVNALKYIQDGIPRPKLTSQPFYNRDFRPTDAQIKDLEERIAATSDPFYLTRKIEDGTLSKTHLEAVAHVWPGLGNMIALRIRSLGDEGMLKGTPGATLSYADRNRLQTLQTSLTRLQNAQAMAPTVPTKNYAAQLQATYKSGKTQPAPSRISGSSKSVTAAQTQLERIASRS